MLSLSLVLVQQRGRRRRDLTESLLAIHQGQAAVVTSVQPQQTERVEMLRAAGGKGACPRGPAGDVKPDYVGA